MSTRSGVKRGPYKPRLGSVGTADEAVCRKCGLTKQVGQFRRDRTRKHGVHPYCTSCRSKADEARLWSRSAEQREAERQRLRQHYRENRRRIIDRSKEWAALNPEHRRAYLKQWAKDNPKAVRAHSLKGNHRRRARLAGVASERINFTRIAVRDRMRCHLCSRKVARARLHFDHVIPLAAGGEHIEANIAVSHARCNLTKGAKRLTLF